MIHFDDGHGKRNHKQINSPRMFFTPFVFFNVSVFFSPREINHSSAANNEREILRIVYPLLHRCESFQQI